MILPDFAYKKVESLVTSGKPNLEGIDYQAARRKMRSLVVDKSRLRTSEEKPDDLIAVYDKVNAAVMAIPRFDWASVVVCCVDLWFCVVPASCRHLF